MNEDFVLSENSQIPLGSCLVSVSNMRQEWQFKRGVFYIASWRADCMAHSNALFQSPTPSPPPFLGEVSFYWFSDSQNVVPIPGAHAPLGNLKVNISSQTLDRVFHPPWIFKAKLQGRKTTPPSEECFFHSVQSFSHCTTASFPNLGKVKFQ